MKIINETELMTNQKASAVVVPDKQFEALQTADGNSLLFSIGQDNILYCTAEIPGHDHGWVRLDLSTALSKRDFGGKTVIAKTFDVGQDPVAGVDIALIVTVENQDWLYLSLSNTVTDWSTFVPTFQQIEFDDADNASYASDPFNDVYLAKTGSNQFIFVDIVTDPVAKTLTRYAIDPLQEVTGSSWIQHGLSVSIQAGPVESIVGCGPTDQGINGIYSLYAVDGHPQLVYAPLFDEGDPGGAVHPTDFDLTGIENEIDVNHMAVALSSHNAPFTDLFFASKGTLYFAPNGTQIEMGDKLPTLIPIYTHDLFNDIQSLHVNNSDGNIVLWGQSVNPDVPGTSLIFTMEGVAGQEQNVNSWSYPIPLLFYVENSASYINNTLGNSVIFAHQTDATLANEYLVQLFQDPITTAWQERSILTVPANVITEIYETTTYSSHIEITDDNNVPQLSLPVYVWASSPCSVYVSDANNNASYQTLAFDKALPLTTDLGGTITIMLPVDTIGGITYNVAVQDPTTKQWYTEVVNPLATTAQNLAKAVPDGTKNYLDGNVEDEYGNSTALVSSGDIDDQTKKTNSNNIYLFCQHNSDPTMNKDGLTSDQGNWPEPATALNPVSTVRTVKAIAAKPQRLGKDLRFNHATDKIWGTTFGKGAKQFVGIEAMKEMGVTLNEDNSLSITTKNGVVLGGSNWFEAKAGHLFKWMKNEAHKLEQAVIKWGTDGLDCLITIAGQAYHFLVKCMNDIANVIHTVLNSIKTAFKDIVAWIGMLFKFQDILSTHSVLKNCINIYMNYCWTNIGSVSADITDAFNTLENEVDKITGLPTSGWTPSTVTAGSTTANKTAPSGSKSPSANYGAHHTKNNAGNSDHNYSLDPAVLAEDIFDDLYNMASTEATNIQNAATTIADIIKNIPNKPFTDTIKELMGTVINLILSTAEDFLLTAVDVIQQALSLITNVLDATIHVPVLTYFYKKMTATASNPAGDDLSILDLACLIAALPVTIIYKLVKGAAPFPAGNTTTAILNATDMDSLCDAINALEGGLDSVAAGLLGHGSASGQGMTPLNIAGSISAAVGTAVLNVCISVKANLPKDMSDANTVTNKIYSCISTVSYMLYLLPDLITAIQQYKGKDKMTWYAKMDNACTCIGGGKAFLDAGSAWFTGKLGTFYSYASPALDFFLNLAWQVPTVALSVAQLETQGEDWEKDINIAIALIGGTGFDASGILSPVLAFHYMTLPTGEERTIAVNADVWAIGTANILWGLSGLLTTFDQLPIPS